MDCDPRWSLDLRISLEGTITETSAADVGNESRSRSIVSIACGIFVVGYAGYYFEGTLGALRYLIYALPLFLVASTILQGRVSTSNRSAVAFFLAYLVLASISNVAGRGGGEFASHNFIIISLVIISYIPLLDVSAAQIRFIFLCSLIYLFLAYGVAGLEDIRFLQMLQDGTGSAVVAGYDSNEGGALVGPLYAVFLYAIGAKLQFLLALIMSFVGGKRVAVLAIVVGLSSALLFRNVTALKRRRNCFATLWGALAIINLVATNSNSISEYVFRSLNIAVSYDEVMLGRYAIADEIDRVMDTRPFVESLFGSGPGSADRLAWIVSSGVLTQPHNDWMKILCDYGIAGSIVMTTFMALLFSTSAIAAVIAITVAITMCTDNVLMYLFYHFSVSLMIAYSAIHESATRKAAAWSSTG
jgi:hypothetical protein